MSATTAMGPAQAGRVARQPPPASSAPNDTGVLRAAVRHSRNEASSSGSASGFGIHTARPPSVNATPSSTRRAPPRRTASTSTASRRRGCTRRRNTVRRVKSTSVTSVTTLTCAAPGKGDDPGHSTNAERPGSSAGPSDGG